MVSFLPGFFMGHFQENFLHLVWKYQYYNKNQLLTTEGVPIEVVKIGYHNFHEGPDFNESTIRLGNMTYYGHIEIHHKSSDWKFHCHQEDKRYNSVILHVVWDHDEEIMRNDGTTIPTLELKGKVLLEVVRNYERLLSSQAPILCEKDLSAVPQIIKFSMIEKALVERIVEKSNFVLRLLEKNNNDWEETAYQWIFYCFGFKTNSTTMLKLAASLPYKLIKKNAGHRLVLESLILGQAGLLAGEVEDDYTAFLEKEYNFYQKKYDLKLTIYPSEWKFMRVRPSNYPTIRMVQLAAILNRSPNIFSSVLHEMNSRKSFKEILSFPVNDYWQHHYHLGKKTSQKLSRELSESILDLLAINFVVPLWYAYGLFTDVSEWQEKCFDFLQGISAEKNSVLTNFSEREWMNQNAFDSQGLIGLFRNYCTKKKCLECKIGQNLLRPLKK